MRIFEFLFVCFSDVYLEVFFRSPLLTSCVLPETVFKVKQFPTTALRYSGISCKCKASLFYIITYNTRGKCQ